MKDREGPITVTVHPEKAKGEMRKCQYPIEISAFLQDRNFLFFINDIRL